MSEEEIRAQQATSGASQAEEPTTGKAPQSQKSQEPPTAETQQSKKEELLEKYHQVTMLQFFALGKRKGFVGRVGRPIDNPLSGQGRVLACLKLKDGISTRDLAQILGMSISSLNEMLAKMEKAGYIERKPSNEDKRVMLVFVTEQGQAIQQSEPPEVNLLDPDPFSGFSDEELKTLDVFFDRMIANLEANIGKDDLEHLKRKREERKEYLRAQFGNSSEAFAKVADELASFHRGGFGFGGFTPHAHGAAAVRRHQAANAGDGHPKAPKAAKPAAASVAKSALGSVKRRGSSQLKHGEGAVAGDSACSAKPAASDQGATSPIAAGNSGCSAALENRADTAKEGER